MGKTSNMISNNQSDEILLKYVLYILFISFISSFVLFFIGYSLIAWYLIKVVFLSIFIIFIQLYLFLLKWSSYSTLSYYSTRQTRRIKIIIHLIGVLVLSAFLEIEHLFSALAVYVFLQATTDFEPYAKEFESDRSQIEKHLGTTKTDVCIETSTILDVRYEHSPGELKKIITKTWRFRN